MVRHVVVRLQGTLPAKLVFEEVKGPVAGAAHVSAMGVNGEQVALYWRQLPNGIPRGRILKEVGSFLQPPAPLDAGPNHLQVGDSEPEP